MKKRIEEKLKAVNSRKNLSSASTISQTGAADETAVFFEDFENSPAEAPFTLPAGWTDIPTPADGKGWTTEILFGGFFPGHSGERYASTTADPVIARDTWAITPGISLTAGKLYRISFWVSLEGFYTSERLEVKLGTSADVTSLNTLIFDNGENDYYDWTEISYEYAPQTDGNYFIGFHSFSPANEDYTLLDDVKVEEIISTVPNVPTNFTVTADAAGALSATLAWTNPSVTKLEQPLTALNSIVIQRDGTTIHTIENPVPGAAGEWTDSSPANGNHTYTIYATNADGIGRSVSQPVFIGLDPCVFGIRIFPYTYDFEDESIFGCWNIYDADGIGSEWGSIWEHASDLPHSGNFSVRHSYAFASFGNQNGWLISPKVIVPEGKVINLSFLSYNEGADSYGKNSVWISDKSNNVRSGDFVKVWSPESVTEDWIETQINLAPYMGKEIYIAFCYEGTNAYSWYIDDLNFTEFQGVDVGVSAVIAPVNGHLTGAENITVKVTNYGTEPLVDVPVEVRIDNATPISGTVSVDFGKEVEYTFPTPVDLSNEKTYYSIESYTKLGTDQNPANDTVKVKIANTGNCAISGFPYKEDFENEINLLCWNRFYYDGDGEINGWKLTTDNAQGGEYSIFHTYGPTNQDGWLVSPEIQIPADGIYRFSFRSYNGYPTWYGRNTVYISEKTNNPQSVDFEKIWSPETVTDSWVETKINLTRFAGKEIYIAFRYEGNNTHAWYLDDVKVELLTGADAGVTAISSPTGGANLTTTETITVKVKNFGAGTLTDTPVKISVDGGTPITETIPSIGFEQEEEYTFTQKLDLSAVKTYTITAYTEYPADTDLSNDTTTISVTNDGNIAIMGNFTSVTSCGIRFVDEGKDEYYSNDRSETQTATFYPETPGDKLKADFIAFSSFPYEAVLYGGYLYETFGDTLYVYNGNTADESLLIGALTGDLRSDLPLPFRSSASDGSLTFVFKKNSGITREGWDANITCFTPLPNDAAIGKILSPVKDGESPAQVKVLIANYGTNPVASLDVAYTLNNSNPVVETYTGNIGTNATVEFTFSQPIDFSEYKDYTLKVYSLLANDGDRTNDTVSFSFTHKENVILSGYRIYDETLSGVEDISVVSFDIWHPSVITIESTYRDGDNIICAGEVAGDYIYVYTRVNDYYGTPANFVKLTKNWTEVSSVPVTIVPNDLTYDYTTETLYGFSPDNYYGTMLLQTVNLETGELTTVATITNVNNYLYAIAAGLDGNLYGIDYNGNLVSIDKSTGEGTLIKSTGIKPQYFQSMTFDRSSGRLFWAMYNTKSQGKLIELDPVTGALTDWGTIGGNAQIVALHTKTSEVKIPEVNKQKAIAIFPNPAKDAVYISYVPENSTIRILDLTGKLLESRKVANSSNNVKLDLNLTQGIYFIQIENNKTKTVQKLIIK